MNDMRRAVRYPMALSVRYNVNATYFEGLAKTCDISTSGAKLEVSKRHNVGDRLGLMIGGPSSSSLPLSLEADVVWRKNIEKLFDKECNYLLGLSFRRIRDHQKSIILGYAVDNGMHKPLDTGAQEAERSANKLRYIDYGFSSEIL